MVLPRHTSRLGSFRLYCRWLLLSIWSLLGLMDILIRRTWRPWLVHLALIHTHILVLILGRVTILNNHPCSMHSTRILVMGCHLRNTSEALLCRGKEIVRGVMKATNAWSPTGSITLDTKYQLLRIFPRIRPQPVEHLRVATIHSALDLVK